MGYSGGFGLAKIGLNVLPNHFHLKATDYCFHVEQCYYNGDALMIEGCLLTCHHFQYGVPHCPIWHYCYLLH